MITSSALSVRVRADSESKVSIAIAASPERTYSQWFTGTEAKFNTTIENLGVKVSPGEIVNATDPNVKYTGNFTVEVTMYMEKLGVLWYGGQSVGYTTFINNTQVHEYLSLPIPMSKSTSIPYYRYPYSNYTFTVGAVGKTISLGYGYNLTKGPEIVGARPDENLALFQRVTVYIQTYSENSGIQRPNTGIRTNSTSATYYVIDTVKKEYVEGKLQDIKTEVNLLNMVSSQSVKIDKAKYRNDLSVIDASVTAGDYVNALRLIQNYEQFTEPTLIANLFVGLNQTGALADNYAVLKPAYDQLVANFTQMTKDFDTIFRAYDLRTQQVNQLTAQMETQRQNYYTLIAFTGVIATFAGYVVGRRLRAR